MPLHSLAVSYSQTNFPIGMIKLDSEKERMRFEHERRKNWMETYGEVSWAYPSCEHRRKRNKCITSVSRNNKVRNNQPLTIDLCSYLSLRLFFCFGFGVLFCARFGLFLRSLTQSHTLISICWRGERCDWCAPKNSRKNLSHWHVHHIILKRNWNCNRKCTHININKHASFTTPKAMPIQWAEKTKIFVTAL